MGGRVTGGLIMGSLGCLGLGVLCLGGGLEHVPQPRMGVSEEMKSIQSRRRAEVLDDSMVMGTPLVQDNVERV
ncbi:hypothetical protein C9925_01815 [cyanobacterium G8-9]|nr:hypothetical protein C9925_01815 [cyanobacterium G8-9]